MIISNVNIITNRIKKAVDNKEPLSMVRLGDGEFIVIKYPKYSSDKLCRDRIGRWFDTSKLSTKQIRSIRNQIYRACLNADILGVPTKREQNKMSKWRWFQRQAREYKLINKKKLYYHFYKVQQINYKLILRDVKEISCITCRDIRDQIKDYFELDKVNMFLLPPETFLWNKRIIKHNKQIVNRIQHYPDMFETVSEYLQKNDQSGKVYLIGAGGLGKSYCNMIKQSGGVALDIGALFDGWTGLFTRPFLRKPERYKL